MTGRRRGPRRRPLSQDLFAQREFDELRQRLVVKHSVQRRAVLTAEMQKYLRRPPAFAVDEATHHTGAPEVRLTTAGEAREVGHEFKHVRRFRLLVQETLRLPDGQPPFYVARYSYQLFSADTGACLLRFEYHPDLPDVGEEQNPWSLIHHVHFLREDPRLARVHIPIWPFLQDPTSEPHRVLLSILAWCKADLKD